MQLLTADEVATRLGVKVETVYAYVSRGNLTSRRDDSGRRSAFDPEEVERLARRGRPRRTTRPPVLDFTIETGITVIGDHRIAFRGRDVLELAATASFEQVAELLWTRTLPDPPPRWPTSPPDGIEPDIGGAPDLTDHLRLAVVRAAATDPLRHDLRTDAVVTTARTLITTTVDGLPVRRSGGGTVARRLWARLTSERPRRGWVDALDAALVLLADHELASSTLAARVAASTRADPYSVVLAGLGPLAGPLHGGASRGVRTLLDEAGGPAGPTRALGDSVRLHGSWPGFGHPLYPHGDPRAHHLLSVLRSVGGTTRAMATVDAVIDEAARRSPVHPNIDFALGALGHLAAMPAEAGEVIFTVSRMAGWIAHAIEEYGEAPLRYRARAVPRT